MNEMQYTKLTVIKEMYVNDDDGGGDDDDDDDDDDGQ